MLEGRGRRQDVVRVPRGLVDVEIDDARAHGFTSGEVVRLKSRSGSIEVAIEVTDAVMRGVVSLPHGWGHGRPGVQLSVASQHAGVSANDVTDELFVDQACGTAVLNGVLVSCLPLPRGAATSSSAPPAR